MRVLVTGAGSPLGRRVVRALGGEQVVQLVRPDQAIASGLRADLVVPDSYGPAIGPVAAVVHLDQRAQATDGQVLDTNLKGTQALLHACAWLKPRLFLHLSTALLDHASPDEPDVSPDRYGSAWLAGACAAEARVNLWARRTGTETVVVRAGHAYGAVGLDGPLTGFLEAAATSAEGTGVLALRGAETALPFVHVDDLAAAIAARVQGGALPAERTFVASLGRVDAVGLVASLAQVHQAFCARTERTARLIEPRTALGRLLYRQKEPQLPRFLQKSPVHAANGAWCERYGQRRLSELAEALVGGAC